MDFNPVGWFEIYVDDMERAKAFYESVLGHKLEPLPLPADHDAELSMVAFPMSPEGRGASGALVKADRVAAGGSNVLVYFSCEDCGINAARVADAGGELMRDKMSIGEYGFCAIAVDPEGNTFGMHSLQ